MVVNTRRRKPEAQPGATRATAGSFKLVIVHFHLRPGGIRRVIELATPYIARHFKGHLSKIVLATGEAADEKWDTNFKRLLKGYEFENFLEPAFGYFSEMDLSPKIVRARIRSALEELLDCGAGRPKRSQDNADLDSRQTTADANCVVWAHNLGIARNLVLAEELVRLCREKKIPLISQHHDWWFDNRWLRWPEMRNAGYRTFHVVAKTILPSAGNIRHLAINRCEAGILEEHFDSSAGWLPNLSERDRLPEASRVRSARAWLNEQVGRNKVPIWILPCRLIRRKNIAEALLLTRWLRPEAWLVTTRAVSSAEEQPYFEKLQQAIEEHGWQMKLGVLEGDETNLPNVGDLIAASEAMLLTSIQEGFGLPYLEAASAQRPLIARSIPNIAPDLKQFGFRFPQYYDELMIDPSLFDWAAELKRQTHLYQTWRAALPPAYRRIAARPVVLTHGTRPAPVSFGRLTLTAQLDVLAQPVAESWRRCVPLNPFLNLWRKRAAEGRLQVSAWPRSADKWLSGRAYAERFARILASRTSSKPNGGTAYAAQEDFIRDKLHARHMFPLLWSSES